MRKYIEKICPAYAIIPLICCFSINMLIYSMSMMICDDWQHYDLTSKFDQQVPLLPSWIFIYLGCYIFWAFNYILVGHIYKNDRREFYRFVATDIISRLICGLFFFLMPTTNVRPEVLGDSFAESALRFLYHIDKPSNLFPSIHCIVSWMCFVGIRGSKLVPKGYKAVSCVIALLVVISTQVLKQHYIVDAIAGLALVELLYALNKNVDIYKIAKSTFEKINNLISRIIKERYVEKTR